MASADGSSEQSGAECGSDATRRTSRALWWRVVLVSILAALFHIAPFWRAQWSVAPGWTFTENLTISPDYMQYRVWERQAAESGPLVENRFTTEPNRPHLFVSFYWAIGRIARTIGVSPERVYAYAGVPLAFLLALLVFVTVRYFVRGDHPAWWTYLSIMLGGGIGAHLKIANELRPLRENFVFRRLVTEPLDSVPVFEEYRSHYVVKTLLDSHFLLVWIVALASVMAFHMALRRGRIAWYASAAALFAASTFLHVYEGVTLMAIALGIAACWWPVREHRGRVVQGVLWCGIATAASLGVLSYWFASSGIPIPGWRAVDVLIATVVLAYPAAVALIAWGGREYWRRAGLDERTLVGWAFGCTVVTLSAPFYPYPDRGTMTMQVPLMIIAAGIYFARWPRLTWRALVVGVALMGAAPLWLVARTWKYSGFRDDAPFMYINGGHREVLDSLVTKATSRDVLLADGPDLLWLAPTFPGRHYVAHFFLTVDYERKYAQLARLLDSASPADAAFLTGAGVRWFFVNADRHPERFASIPRLTPVVKTNVGWLFEARGAIAP